MKMMLTEMIIVILIIRSITAKVIITIIMRMKIIIIMKTVMITKTIKMKI